MIEVTGVRFKKAGKIYYFDPNHYSLSVDDYVIVETARGVEFGKVVIANRTVDIDDVVLPLKKVIRVADKDDIDNVAKNEAMAAEALSICAEKINNHQLEMNLVDVEYTFDRNKVIFYFTAEGRIDFRELVKDLAARFKTRIELRQIGVRDEAKLLGGIGPCGRMLCCSTFLGDFEPVSIKMAKDQSLSLNPSKISGLCGRLMCRLRYENEVYEKAKQLLPDIGEEIETVDGKGIVVNLNFLEKTIDIEMKEIETTIQYTLDELMEKNIVPVQ